jgi:hypothetical protein
VPVFRRLIRHPAVSIDVTSIFSTCARTHRLAVELHCSSRYASMMKIQTRESDGQIVFEIEGRLAGAFVPELDGCWQAALREHPDRKVSVDVKSVTCIDRAGRLLLEKMYGSGVRFLRAGLAIQDILEQVMEQPECKH